MKLERSEGLGTENGILVLAFVDVVVAVLKIGRRKEDLAAIVAAISLFSPKWKPVNLRKTLVPKPVNLPRCFACLVDEAWFNGLDLRIHHSKPICF